jgi:hypothetical protein
MMKITNIQLGPADILLKHYLEDKYPNDLSNVAISDLIGRIVSKLPPNLNAPPDINLGLGTSDQGIKYILEKTELKEYFEGEVQKWIDFEKIKEAEFKKAIQSVEHIIKSKSYIIPIYWDQFYYGEFLESYGYKSNKIHTYRLKELPRIEGKEILKWVKREQDNSTEELVETKIQLETLSHKLKLLHVSGILDLVDDIFTPKNCDNPDSPPPLARKSEFLKIILSYDKKTHDITRCLNNKEYQSTVAKDKTAKIFIELGYHKFFESNKGYEGDVKAKK